MRLVVGSLQLTPCVKPPPNLPFGGPEALTIAQTPLQSQLQEILSREPAPIIASLGDESYLTPVERPYSL